MGYNGLNLENSFDARIGFKTSTLLITKFGLNSCVIILHKGYRGNLSFLST